MHYQTIYNVIPSLYLSGVSPNLSGWEDILFHFDSDIEDQEVWEIARQCKDIPHLGNIYQSLVINRLESLFWEQIGLDYQSDQITLFTFVNNFDSHFCINDQAVNTLDDFIAKVDEIKSTIH